MQSFPRAIAHIDADCFFASVELLHRPELKGKPVMVCNRTDRRGIVLAATYEARPFGIRAGTPVFKAEKLCPRGILIPSHFDFYRPVSHRLMEILKNFSPDVEVCSIDEAYVDLIGLRLLHRTCYRGIGEMIQKTVAKNLGITVSIGIAGSKLLAKIASDFRKPSGLTVVSSKNLPAFLRLVPLGNIPGVGPNTKALLEKYDLKTAHDVASWQRLPELLGIRGKELQTELNGMALSKVEDTHSAPKSLSHTRTFPDFSTNRSYIYAFSLKLLLSLARHLREYSLEAGRLSFFLLTKDFTSKGIEKKLSPPTDEDQVFITAFQEMFDCVFTSGPVFRKAGFFMNHLRPKGPKQTELFTPSKNGNLSAAIDTIYRKFGGKGITRGSLLKSP